MIQATLLPNWLTVCTGNATQKCMRKRDLNNSITDASFGSLVASRCDLFAGTKRAARQLLGGENLAKKVLA